MGIRLARLVDRIREDKGPFFIARLCLRMDFPIDDLNAPDDTRKEEALLKACADLGYDLKTRSPDALSGKK